jgi:hypothetical protein
VRWDRRVGQGGQGLAADVDRDAMILVTAWWANQTHPVSNRSVPQNVLRALWLAVAIGSGSCEQAQKSADSPIPTGTPPLTKRIPPECHIDAPSACRVGCDADVPKKVMEVAPDLSGLDVTGLNGVEIVEILIDVRGYVQEACLLRGVREDVDDRAIAAIRQWRFEPARLRHSTSPRLPVPIVMTVTLPIDASL